ncbi:MAG TPA: mechanosensitive ion channel family protein [Spongiibacteraceae bacterium]|nr:mechanosensitive ion channel family protein [Spongiibacteraceae bacterium]
MAKPDSIQHIFNTLDLDDLIRTSLLLMAGLIFSWLYGRMIKRGVLNHLPSFIQKLGSWLILAIFIGMALHQLGFKLSVLLGAAGIFSVALGFAAQTSAANLISGLFVVSERSFQVGDSIQVGNHNGEVLSVDMLSVKLRTSDNRYVRIPNELLIKSDVVNLSKFPIRRFDLKLSVAYDSDIAHVRAVLLKVATNNLICLEEPRPLLNLQGFGESSIDLQFTAWATRENYQDLRNSIQEQIKIAFEVEGIQFPFPTRTLLLPEIAANFAKATDDPRSKPNSDDQLA